ncbi:DUF5719 family protein [Curtobacterium sp. MCPF17_052]|nr:DUF5719 family protein [Curtobacterium sp. MCPF17_052]WIB12994.1 DUF5719 family protein [Curtobacterium sp. MCPF17_052]
MSTSTARRWALRGTATVAAVVVAAGTIAAAHTIGTTVEPGHPAGRTVTPVPAAAERVCAGSALRLSDDAGNDATRASTIGSPEIATATTGDRVDRSELGSASTGSSVPTLLTAPAGDTAPQVAGSSSQSVSDGDVVGVGAASCDDPSQSTWLVGGSTETGRTSLVTLSNPTDVNATVDLSIADTSGTVSAPGTTGIVVAPNSQKVVPLSGFVTDQGSTVVHVTSSGGQIVAHMQETVVRTLTPRRLRHRLRRRGPVTDPGHPRGRARGRRGRATRRGHRRCRSGAASLRPRHRGRACHARHHHGRRRRDHGRRHRRAGRRHRRAARRLPGRPLLVHDRLVGADRRGGHARRPRPTTGGPTSAGSRRPSRSPPPRSRRSPPAPALA